MATLLNEPNIPVTTDADGNKVSQLVNPFGCGDCQMGANAQIILTFIGGTKVRAHWTGEVSTQNAEIWVGDQWHQGIYFFTAFSPDAVFEVHFDGPRMHDDLRIYPVDQTKDFDIQQPDAFPNITSATWQAQC